MPLLATARTLGALWTTLFYCLVQPDVGLSQTLSSLISLSQTILSNDRPISAVGNVNILAAGEDAARADDNDRLALCYMPYLIKFTVMRDHIKDPIPYNTMGAYEGLAAISLAMEHLNTGDGTIVPELDGIHKRCPLRFSTKSFDTQAQQSVGVNHAISLTDRTARQQQQQLLPCALIGASMSSISIPTSIISGVRGFPQISPISTSAALDDKSQYKLFGRTCPNDDGTAIPLIFKLRSWGVNHLGVIHVLDSYGNAFAEGLRLAAKREAPDLRITIVNVANGADDAKIFEVIRQLKETRFTYFFGILHGEMMDTLMTEAYHQGIAGTGRHVWLFSDGAGNTASSRSFAVGSPLERAYRGTGVLSPEGGVPGMENFDKLERAMQGLKENEDDLSYLEAHLPSDYAEGMFVNHSLVTSQDSYLARVGVIHPFLYDATVALGIASCRLAERGKDKNEYFTGEELFEAFLNTTFDGTSGTVSINPNTGTRDYLSAFYSLTNFVDDEGANVEEGMARFKGVRTGLFVSGQWEALLPYSFNNGNNEIPPGLPTLVTNNNCLSTGWKAFGMALCSIVVSLALGFSSWTFYNRNEQVVRASQPIFLLFVSGGTLLMGLAIIPLSIDKNCGVGQEGGNAICMSIPWLLAVGFSLTFSALFAKTYRINKIMQRTAKYQIAAVTATDVMKPMIALLLLNIVVLTVWTVVDPLQHETIIIAQDVFKRNLETNGVCKSSYSSIFIALLCAINMGSLLYSVFQAYKARNISTELQESTYIFAAMMLILLVSFLGIPVIAMNSTDVAAFFFVSSSIIFAVCCSILLLIFLPKCIALREKKKMTLMNDAQPCGSVVRISGISNSTHPADGIRMLNLNMANSQLEMDTNELREKVSAQEDKIFKLMRQMLSLNEESHQCESWRELPTTNARAQPEGDSVVDWSWIDEKCQRASKSNDQEHWQAQTEGESFLDWSWIDEEF